MNDKTKHRIVGIVVVAAFLVILIPALMKDESSETKQSQQTQYAPDERPVTAMVEPVSSSSVESESYESNQVAQVSLDKTSVSQQPLASSNEQVAQPSATPVSSHDSMESMESIESSTTATPATASTPAPVVQAVAPPLPKTKPQPKPQPKPVIVTPAPVKPKPVVKETVVVVTKPKPVVTSIEKLTNVCFQLGTFSNPSNASLLVTRLKEKGFTTAKTTTIILPMGRKVQRVTYCKPMTRAEMVAARNRLALLVGTSPMIAR